MTVEVSCYALRWKPKSDIFLGSDCREGIKEVSLLEEILRLFRGRINLIKVALLNIPFYYMFMFKMS